MIEFAIARRYLLTARRRRHTAFLSIISMLGLAIGVFALLFSIALMAGFQNRIKGRMMASSPQLLIEPAGRNTIADAGRIVDESRRRGMASVNAVITGIGWGANEEERRGRPMRLRAVQDGGASPDPDAIAVTRDFAASLGLNTGETVLLVAPRTRLTPFGPVPVVRKYRIAKLVYATNDDRNADGFLPFDEASSLLGTGGEPTAIEMYGSEARAEELQPQLAKTFPNVQVKTWKEINRPLFLALRLEKIVMFVTISLIVFVAALNLISTLSMLIMEKRPQVGVLRTLGASERSILSIFLQVGLLIGLTGTLVGNVFGIALPWIFERWKVIPLPPDVYGFAHVPFALDLSDVLVINAVAVVLSVLSTWYPARIASRLDPIRAIHEG
jgi:lipoprotein-releasing system permease protein